jgi:hypothetical protein
MKWGTLSMAVGLAAAAASFSLTVARSSADPTCSNVPDCVPGITRNAAEGAPCAPLGGPHQYVLGVDASYPNTGRTYICWWGGGTGHPAWTAAPPLYGVMRVGDLCQKGWSAQSTDGYPMLCGDNARWLIYLDDVA